jgi:putative ABC transport system permease protein
VPPIAALREGVGTEERHRSRVMTPLSFLLTGVGVALMVAGLFFVSDEGGALSLLGGGAAASFLGIALLSPRLMKPMAGVLGRPIERVGGVAGHLARENSIRQPGRTAVTAAALMIGIALVTFASIFAAGAKEYIASAVDTGSKAQLVVQNTDGFSPFTSQATEAVRRSPGVESVSAVRFTQAQLGSEKENVTGVEITTLPGLFNIDWSQGSDATWQQLRGDTVVLSKEEADKQGVEVGDFLSLVTTAAKTVDLRVVGIHDDKSPLLSGYVVSNDLLERAWGERKDSFVLVGLKPGSNAKPAIDKLLAARFPQAEALTNEEFKDQQAGQVDQLLMLIYALLALSIIVSLFGIVNTLVLSITERTRELGLLRSIGGSRRFVKRVIRYEAVIVALIGSVLGLAVGVVLGLLVTQAMDEFTLVVPYGTLAGVLVAGAIAGLLAAILPARRAAKLDVLQALAYE